MHTSAWFLDGEIHQLVESSHGIETKYSIPDKLNDSFTTQRNLSSDNKDSKTCQACIPRFSECGFSGTLNNCTINISYK